MAKTINRLTDKTIRNINKPGMYADGGGLYLQVTGKDAKSWVLRYSLNGKAHEMGLGSYRHMSLADARDECERYHKLLRDHLDPIKHRAQQRAANVLADARSITFHEATEAALPTITRDLANAKHASQWGTTLRQYAYPYLGRMFVRDITVHDVHRVLEPIWNTKSETASRVRGRIERILDWCRVKGYCAGENPARLEGNLDLLLGERKKAENHPALPYVEMPAFMAKLRKINTPAAHALEFAILTAARTREVVLATPKEINAKDKLWTVPASHMKLKREHIVPLSGRALELASNTAGKFLFSVDGGELGHSTMRALLTRMDCDATVHGFRSTFKTWCAEQTGVDNYVSEAALAHATGDAVEQAYNRSTYLAKRRHLMEAWANYCAGIKATHDNVTQLRA